MSMFSKFTAFLHQAAEVTSQVLAPQVSKHEEFQAHWRAITDAMATDNGPDSTVDSTGVTTRLTEMVDILCREEEETINPHDPGTMGPCMEFILRHKILDTLYTTAKSDYPSGMGHQVLLFFTVILGRVERPLLHHVSIHQPIIKQVCRCGVKLSKKSSADEVHFIQTLCVRLQRDPRLADFFIKDEKSKRKFVLADALLRLVHSEDNVVVMKAYECLLTCVSLQHSTVTEALAVGQLPIHLASQLQYHFQLIPLSAHSTAILGCQAGWGIDYATRRHTVDHSPATHGLWHMEAFLSWLDFCEQIVGVSQETLGNVVCFTIHEMLLSASLLSKLIKSSEEDILVGTAVLAKSIQTLSCRKLLEEFVSFTLRDSCDPRQKSGGPLLIDKLISRIDHLSDEVCQVTLHLFDILLTSPLPCVMQDLFLSHWSPHTSAPLPTVTSSTPTHSTPTHLPSSPLSDQSIVPEGDLGRVKSDLEEQVKDYLSLLPESLLSCEQVSGGLGLDQYLIDAHQQVAHCRSISATWSNRDDPSEPLPPQSSPAPPTTPPSPSKEITEGLLLTALLNKLEGLLDQPYEVNLLLTSVLSHIASFSHPMIDWLYSTHSKHRGRNVYSILMKLSTDLQSHAERSPGLVVNIIEARRRLSGMETSDLLSMPHNDLLEGAIVLEEFTKELSSVLFAKTTTALLSLSSPDL